MGFRLEYFMRVVMMERKAEKLSEINKQQRLKNIREENDFHKTDRETGRGPQEPRQESASRHVIDS